MTSSARSAASGSPGGPAAASREPQAPPHRRHHSELDMNSLRRISEALLLAQNRARRATERATRSERLLHAVFARVDDATAAALRLEMDALAVGDAGGTWRPPQSLDDLALDAAASPTSLTTRLMTSRRRAFDEDSEDEEGGRELSQMAREIVANLGVAGARHRLLVDHVAARVAADDSALARVPSRLARRRSPSDPPLLFLGVSPLQFVAGLLVGVCMGAALARLVAPPLAARQQSLVSKLSKWCGDRARVGRYYAAQSAPHALPFPLDDLGYWGHPSAIEVA